MLAGLPVDDVSLRFLLVPILQANDLSDLLIENGGKFLYQHGWAARFWKRHNLVSRVVTTKMRIIPANFDEMEEKYISDGEQRRGRNVYGHWVWGMKSHKLQSPSL